MKREEISNLIEECDAIREKVYNSTNLFLAEHKNSFLRKITRNENGGFEFTDPHEDSDVYVEIEDYDGGTFSVNAFGMEKAENGNIIVYAENDGEIETYDYADVTNSYRPDLLFILADGETIDL